MPEIDTRIAELSKASAPGNTPTLSNSTVKASSGSGSAPAQVVSEEAEKLRAQLASTVLTEKPNVSFDSVAGLEEAKEALVQAVVYLCTISLVISSRRYYPQKCLICM